MDWISNRERAIIICAVVLGLLALRTPNTRKALLNMMWSLWNKYIVTIGFGLAASAFITLAMFEPKDGWSHRQIWLAFIWGVTIAMPIVFKLAKRSQEAKWSVVSSTLFSAFSYTVVIDFLANYASGPLWFEICLVVCLLISVIFIMTRIKMNHAKQNPDRVEPIFIVYGLVLLSISIVSIIIYPDKFLKIDVAIDFSVPLLLTATSSIFMCIVFIYINYTNALVRVQFFIHDADLVDYAKRAGATSFGMDIGALKYWLDVLAATHPSTRPEVELSLRCAYLRIPIGRVRAGLNAEI